MGQAPKVTVLTTLFNKGPWVVPAVESVLAQTFTDFEILVVDDGSTDDGPSKVQELARRDGRIRLLESHLNTGRAAAANRGFDAARGKYVAVLDADDLMHPERLAKQVAFMDGDRTLAITGSYHQAMGRSDHIGQWPLTDEACRAGMLFRDPVLYGSSIIRRPVLERHGLRCNAQWRLPGMDYLFVLAVGQYGRYANLAEPLVYYRLGENNMRHGRTLEHDKRALIAAVFGFFGLPITADELPLQMVLNDVPPMDFNAGRVQALRRWADRLVALNQAQGIFPQRGFEQEVERRWRMVFHTIADQSLGGGWAHLRHGAAWEQDRAIYLLKTTANRWLGRKPKDS